MDEPTYSKDSLPFGGPEGPSWGEFRKVATTRMIRIDGAFTVVTSEGPVRCDDGWLAVDARGYPYPIATEEQALIYEPALPPEEPETEEPPA